MCRSWSAWSGSALFAYVIFSESLLYEILEHFLYMLIKLEMCQYDTDAPTQGHPHPHAGILKKKKMKLKKAP